MASESSVYTDKANQEPLCARWDGDHKGTRGNHHRAKAFAWHPPSFETTELRIPPVACVQIVVVCAGIVIAHPHSRRPRQATDVPSIADLRAISRAHPVDAEMISTGPRDLRDDRTAARPPSRVSPRCPRSVCVVLRFDCMFVNSNRLGHELGFIRLKVLLAAVSSLAPSV